MRSSAAASKRDFLQKKGLTEAEIEEAFRRVPQEAAAPAPAAAAPSAMAATLQHLQPGSPYGAAPQQQHPQQQAVQPYVAQGMALVPAAQVQPGVRWTQVALGAGFVAASAYAAKALVWPYMEGAYYTVRPRGAGGGGEGGSRSMRPE